jgi:outer membrane protein TolC
MKTTYPLFLTTTLIFAVAAELSAGVADGEATTRSLSLGEVTSAVLANNAAIKEALNKWNAARARIPQAAAWDDPRLGGDTLVHRFVNVPPNAFMDQSVSIEQVVPITGKNLTRARAAMAEAISAYEDVRRVQLDAIAAARASFFRLANAYDQLEINRKNIDSLKQIADISRAKYEAGIQSAADVLVAETDHS